MARCQHLWPAGSGFKSQGGDWMYLTTVGRGNTIYIEVFVVPEISRVQNELLELMRENYPHFANI